MTESTPSPDARHDESPLRDSTDERMAKVLSGTSTGAHLRRELQEEDSIYGVAVGIGWRPKQSFELAFVGAYGNALGRSNDESSLTARLGLTWRW